jgi:hypothetical protein
MFFKFSYITGGSTEKVFQFLMQLKSICIKTFSLLNITVFLNTGERLKTVKDLYNDIIFVKKLFL